MPAMQSAGIRLQLEQEPDGICPVCLGGGHITEYRLFDPKKPASGLQRALQANVVGAFVSLCFSYVSRIMQKIDTLHQEREARSGPPPVSAAVYPEGAFLPLVAVDLPARCVGHPSEEVCRVS